MAEIDLEVLERHTTLRDGALDMLVYLSDLGLLKEGEAVTVSLGEDYITLSLEDDNEDATNAN